MANERMFEEMNAWRGYLLKSLDGLSDEQWQKTPDGFKNNILWNAGHIAWAQAAFIYDMSGVESPISADYKTWFDNGSSPAGWETMPDIAEVKATLASLGKSIQADHEAGKFGERTPFDLGGITINTFEDAMAFNTWHEGIHLGIIMQLRHFV